MKVSDRLKFELLRRRAAGERQYRIARAAGVHPTIVSAIINDALPVRENDPRVMRLAGVLGLSLAEAFEESNSDRQLSEGGAPQPAA